MTEEGTRPPDRSPQERAADHAAIDRLAGDVLPALVARLSASGLCEIEVREGDWKVRLRRPAGGGQPASRRQRGERPSRTQPGHAEHGHPPGALETHLSARSSTNGSKPPMSPVGPGRSSDPRNAHPIATSPAVGLFQPRPDLRPGARVRAGDRLGVVDVLGVPQDVVAPVDGIFGAALAEPGQAVEYGQELVRIEAIERSSDA